jgi:ABC-2 type transport system ATP-binding protein
MHAGRVVAAGTPDELTRPVEGEAPRSLEDVFVHHLAGGRSLPPVASFVAEAGPAGGPAEGPTVQAERLTCRFGRFTAVDDVSLEVHPSEIVGLLGPNGAGKTTLIKMLCGLQAPTAGTAVVAGHDVVRERARVRGSIGYMSQRFALYRDQTVRENLRLSAGLYGLALASAILHEPRVLFLDEPTAGVDPLARRQFWDLVHRLAHQRGVGVLVSTHYMDEAAHCDRLGFMHQGRLVAVGRPDELTKQAEQAGGPMVAVEAPEFARAFVLVHERIPDAMLYGRRIRWQSRRPDAEAAEIETALTAAGVTARAEIQPLSMEDTFVSVLQAAGLDRG